MSAGSAQRNPVFPPEMLWRHLCSDWIGRPGQTEVPVGESTRNHSERMGTRPPAR